MRNNSRKRVLVFLSIPEMSCTLLVISCRQLMCILWLEVIILMSRADFIPYNKWRVLNSVHKLSIRKQHVPFHNISNIHHHRVSFLSSSIAPESRVHMVCWLSYDYHLVLTQPGFEPTTSSPSRQNRAWSQRATTTLEIKSSELILKVKTTPGFPK